MKQYIVKNICLASSQQESKTQDSKKTIKMKRQAILTDQSFLLKIPEGFELMTFGTKKSDAVSELL